MLKAPFPNATTLVGVTENTSACSVARFTLASETPSTLASALSTRRFRPLVDLYREAGRRAGLPPEHLKVGVHVLGYVVPTMREAIHEFFPGHVEGLTKGCRERVGDR